MLTDQVFFLSSLIILGRILDRLMGSSVFWKYFHKVPLLGMTATATRRACRDIIESLGMFNPAEVIGNPDRPNIYYSA